MSTTEEAPDPRVVPEATVIIPAKDAERTISAQLEALSAQSFDGTWEVLVADNGSSDRTRELAQGFLNRLPSLRIVDASEVPGSSHARNVAARSARAELLCFCDADDVVGPTWLEALVHCAGRWGIVGGRLEVETLNAPEVRAWRSSPEAARATEQISFAPSSNMAIRADIFRELGGFDEAYPKSHDVELSHRAMQAGHRIGFCKDAVVAYRLRSDLRGLAHQAFRAGRANAQMFADGQEDARTISTTLRDWAWLIVRIPTVVSRMRRGIWIRRAAQAAGRLAGSIRWRVLYL